MTTTLDSIAVHHPGHEPITWTKHATRPWYQPDRRLPDHETFMWDGSSDGWDSGEVFAYARHFGFPVELSWSDGRIETLNQFMDRLNDKAGLLQRVNKDW